MLEQGPQEIRAGLPPRYPGLKEKRKREPRRAPRGPGVAVPKGRPAGSRGLRLHWERLRWTRDCCVLREERTRLGENSAAPGSRTPS